MKRLLVIVSMGSVVIIVKVLLAIQIRVKILEIVEKSPKVKAKEQF